MFAATAVTASVVGEWSTRVVDALRYGMAATDTLWYHLPIARISCKTDGPRICTLRPGVHLIFPGVDRARTRSGSCFSGMTSSRCSSTWMACGRVVLGLVHRASLRRRAGNADRGGGGAGDAGDPRRRRRERLERHRGRRVASRRGRAPCARDAAHSGTSSAPGGARVRRARGRPRRSARNTRSSYRWRPLASV